MKEFFVAGNIIVGVENDVFKCHGVVHVGWSEEGAFSG